MMHGELAVVRRGSLGLVGYLSTLNSALVARSHRLCSQLAFTIFSRDLAASRSLVVDACASITRIMRPTDQQRSVVSAMAQIPGWSAVAVQVQR